MSLHQYSTRKKKLKTLQPRSQGFSSSRPLELQGTGTTETLGTRLKTLPVTTWFLQQHQIL